MAVGSRINVHYSDSYMIRRYRIIIWMNFWNILKEPYILCFGSEISLLINIFIVISPKRQSPADPIASKHVAV